MGLLQKCSKMTERLPVEPPLQWLKGPIWVTMSLALSNIDSVIAIFISSVMIILNFKSPGVVLWWVQCG